MHNCVTFSFSVQMEADAIIKFVLIVSRGEISLKEYLQVKTVTVQLPYKV